MDKAKLELSVTKDEIKARDHLLLVIALVDPSGEADICEVEMTADSVDMATADFVPRYGTPAIVTVIERFKHSRDHGFFPPNTGA
jgi:hypothetical protein